MVRLSRDLRPKTVDPPDHHLDLHTGLRSLDQLIDDLLIRKGIQLESEISLSAILGDLDLALDLVDHLILKAFGRYQQMFR